MALEAKIHKKSPPTVLRENPTRISAPPPTANAVNHHANHDDRPLHTTWPYLPLPITTNCNPPLLSQQHTANDSFDYLSKLDEINAAIDWLKCNWPWLTALNHNPNLTCTDSYQLSSPPPPTILSTNNNSYDYKTKLNENKAAIKWMQQRWLQAKELTTQGLTDTANTPIGTPSPVKQPPNSEDQAPSLQQLFAHWKPPSTSNLTKQNDTLTCWPKLVPNNLPPYSNLRKWFSSFQSKSHLGRNPIRHHGPRTIYQPPHSSNPPLSCQPLNLFAIDTNSPHLSQNWPQHHQSNLKIPHNAHCSLPTA